MKKITIIQIFIFKTFPVVVYMNRERFQIIRSGFG